MDKLKEIPILNWEQLSKPLLESVLAEVKEAFQDQLEETESITDKSIKILTLFIGAIAGIGIYFGKFNASTWAYIIFGGLSFVNIAILFWNLKGHEVIGNGCKPQYVLTSDFDKESFSEEKKEKLLLKNLIEQYWNNTNRMETENKGRVSLYDWSFILSILIVITSACHLGTLMIHP